jgi:hypothetical protein
MRYAVIGAVLVASLVFAALLAALLPSNSFADRGIAAPGGTQGLIPLSVPLGEHRQQVTVLDPQMHVMAVYHVDGATGEIVLRSVRNIHWDLQMSEFNGKSPSPKEIHALLDPR